MTKATRANPITRLVAAILPKPPAPAPAPQPEEEEEDIEPTVKMYPRPFVKYGD